MAIKKSNRPKRKFRQRMDVKQAAILAVVVVVFASVAAIVRFTAFTGDINKSAQNVQQTSKTVSSKDSKSATSQASTKQSQAKHKDLAGFNKFFIKNEKERIADGDFGSQSTDWLPGYGYDKTRYEVFYILPKGELPNDQLSNLADGIIYHSLKDWTTYSKKTLKGYYESPTIVVYNDDQTPVSQLNAGSPNVQHYVDGKWVTQ